MENMSTVIVFGPTGNVASVAAATAQEHGATVWLAMRDTQKSIPGFTLERERDGGFRRVQADLTKPDTVATAVKTAGAKRAFIYAAHGSPDHMRSTITSLKTAGIEFVVFLSSFTIPGEPRDVPPTDLIAHSHAQVEINLEEVFGLENYVAVRAGGFATNTLRYKKGILSGEVKMFGSGFKFDAITPTDMGKVSGTILVHGPQNGQRIVYLYGPQIISHRDAIQIIGKILNKDLKITELDEQKGLDHYLQEGIPRPFAEYIIRLHTSDGVGAPALSHYEAGVENVQLYTGKPSMPFQEWVEQNKELFV